MSIFPEASWNLQSQGFPSIQDISESIKHIFCLTANNENEYETQIS